MTNERSANPNVADANLHGPNTLEPQRKNDGSDPQATMGTLPTLNPTQKPNLQHNDPSCDELDIPMTQPEEPQVIVPGTFTPPDTNVTDNNPQETKADISNESGWIKVIKNVKRNQPLISTDAQDPHKPTIQDRIKQRGE